MNQQTQPGATAPAPVSAPAHGAIQSNITPLSSIDMQTKLLRKHFQQILVTANKIVSDDPSKRAQPCLELSQKLEEFELYCDDIYAYIEINKQNVIYNNVNNGGYNRLDSPESLYQSLNVRLSSVKQTRNTVERFSKQVSNVQQQLAQHNNNYKENQRKIQLQIQQQQQQKLMMQQQTALSKDYTNTQMSDIQQLQDNVQQDANIIQQEQQSIDNAAVQLQANSPSVYSPSFLKNSTGDHQSTPTTVAGDHQTPQQGGGAFNPLSPSMNMPSPSVGSGLNKKSPTSAMSMMDGSYDTPSQQGSQLTPSQQHNPNTPLQHNPITPSQQLSQLTPSQPNPITPSQQHNPITPSQHLQQIVEEVDMTMADSSYPVDNNINNGNTTDQQQQQLQQDVQVQDNNEQQQDIQVQQQDVQVQQDDLQQQQQQQQQDQTDDELDRLVNEQLKEEEEKEKLAQEKHAQELQQQQQELQQQLQGQEQLQEQQQGQEQQQQQQGQEQQQQELSNQVDMIDVDNTFEEVFGNEGSEVVDLDAETEEKPMTTDEIEGSLEEIENQDVPQPAAVDGDQQDQTDTKDGSDPSANAVDIDDEVEMEEVMEEVNPDETMGVAQDVDFDNTMIDQ